MRLLEVIDLTKKSAQLTLSRQKIETLIEQVDAVIKNESCRCIDVRWLDSEAVLQVFIDCPEGVDMNTCVRVTDRLNESAILDSVFDFEYTLEVSSPGIERPLRLKGDFQSVVGDKIQVQLLESVEGRRKATGRLLNADDLGFIELQVASGSLRFHLDQLSTADWLAG